MEPFIATSGIRLHLPVEYPLDLAENAGNIVHGNAPRRMFNNTIGSLEPRWRRLTPSGQFRDFVGQYCSHIITTSANLFRVGDFSDAIRNRYKHFQKSIEGFSKPLVIFGLGSQAKAGEVFRPESLPVEAHECIKAIAASATAVSVRGEFTASIFRSVLGEEPENIFVTGCPSYYAAPEAFAMLKANLAAMGESHKRFAVNITNYGRAEDRHLLKSAILKDDFLVEPYNPSVHQFHLAALDRQGFEPAPSDLEFLVSEDNSTVSIDDLAGYFATRYRLFRYLDPWLDFNKEYVRGTVGTRFHVNMASLLAGVPAVWVTHDARTKELTEMLSLPSIDVDDVPGRSLEEIFELADFDSFFSNVGRNFNQFNAFLTHAGLPNLMSPDL